MSGSTVALGALRSVPTVRWRRRDLVVFAPLALMIGYMMSPFVAVARLGYAVRTNDVSVLSDAVDWSRVRSGLDRQIIGSPPPTADIRPAAAVSTADDLPEFGQSFADKATSNALRDTITPTGLEAMLANEKPSSVSLFAEARDVIDGAIFIGLNRFEVRLPSGEGGRSDVIRIGLRFTARHGWRVERVVLPPAAIDGPTQGT